jgi:hypothetical protein
LPKTRHDRGSYQDREENGAREKVCGGKEKEKGKEMSAKENTEPKYHTRPIAWVIKPVGEPIFSEMATRVEIVDEAAGEFVKLTDGRQNTVSLEPSEWPQLWNALDVAFRDCVKNEEAK